MFVVAAPEYLTVSSTGPAWTKQADMMGVYHLTGESHNGKPTWARHEGAEKIFYANGKFILW